MKHLEQRISRLLIHLFQHGQDWEGSFLVFQIFLKNHIPVEGHDGRKLVFNAERTDIDRFLQEHQIQLDIQFTTADPYMTYCMVEEGLGLSLNNDLTTKNWTGRVVTRPFRPRQYIELGIAVPHMKDASPAARKFIACAVQLLSAEEQPNR